MSEEKSWLTAEGMFVIGLIVFATGVGYFLEPEFRGIETGLTLMIIGGGLTYLEQKQKERART